VILKFYHTVYLSDREASICHLCVMWCDERVGLLLLWGTRLIIQAVNTQNCSLSIVLMAMDQKPQKSLKRWYYPPRRLNVNVVLSGLSGLYRCAKFGEIDAVFSIIWNFQYFACLAWKCLIMPPKLGFWGISISTKPPKCASLHESALFELSSVKIRQRV